VAADEVATEERPGAEPKLEEKGEEEPEGKEAPGEEEALEEKEGKEETKSCQDNWRRPSVASASPAWPAGGAYVSAVPPPRAWTAVESGGFFSQTVR